MLSELFYGTLKDNVESSADDADDVTFQRETNILLDLLCLKFVVSGHLEMKNQL